MPYKALKPCSFLGCTSLVKSGYCQAHAHFYNPPARTFFNHNSNPDKNKIYGRHWKTICAEIKRAAGIPVELWHLYDIHHEPPYNPAIEPDHRKYHLTPMLHSDHSRETARQRGRGGKSLQAEQDTDKVKSSFHSTKIREGVADGSR